METGDLIWSILTVSVCLPRYMLVGAMTATLAGMLLDLHTPSLSDGIYG